MADLTTLEVEVDVNEAYIGRVRHGQAAKIALDAYPDTAFRGRVRQVVPTADRQRATVQVKVSILDRDPRILPEMGARVDFLEPDTGGTTGASTPAVPLRLRVPAAAVRGENGQTTVWVIRGERLESRAETEVREVMGARHRVRSGLPDPFIIQNQAVLLRTERGAARAMSQLIVGARRGDIRLQFLLESAVLATAGGAAGVVSGVVVAGLAALIGPWELVLSWQAAVAGLICSTLLGLTVGVVPADRAARLLPVEALRAP